MSAGKQRNPRQPLSSLAMAGLLILLAPRCILLPDGEFKGEREANLPPIIRVTGGVLLDGEQLPEPSAHFFWHGADGDGVVRGFEWAIDDTVSQNAWRRTTAFDAVIPFEASRLNAGGEFTGWHAFFVRAIDNEFARSAPAKRYFNTRTVAPITIIESPRPEGEYTRWARTILVTWRGEDLDAIGTEKVPRYFEIKMIEVEYPADLRYADRVERLFSEEPNRLLGALDPADYPDDDEGEYLAAAEVAWIRVPSSVTTRWLEGMSFGKHYAFAVRSIDEAGAREPALIRAAGGAPGNWVAFQVVDRNIILTVSEPSLGTHRFTTREGVIPWEVTVAPEQPIRFHWEGNAEASGSLPGPSAYGLDIPDPNDATQVSSSGIGGWTGWANRDRMDAAISFPRSAEGTTHHFYVKMRDISWKEETETLAHIVIRVASFNFSKRFLIVDGLRQGIPKSGRPYVQATDEETDQWRWRALAELEVYLPETMAVESLDVLNAWGSDESIGTLALPRDLIRILGDYQNVIWDAGDGSGSRAPAIRQAALTMALSRYVGLGGNLLLFNHSGPVTLIDGSAFPEENGIPLPTCAPRGSRTPGAHWGDFSFLQQFLRLTGCVDKPRGSPQWLNRRSLIGAEAADPRLSRPALGLESLGKHHPGHHQLRVSGRGDRSPGHRPLV